MNCFKGVRVSASKKVMWPIAQLKSLYTSAHSTGNKQDELSSHCPDLQCLRGCPRSYSCSKKGRATLSSSPFLRLPPVGDHSPLQQRAMVVTVTNSLLCQLKVVTAFLLKGTENHQKRLPKRLANKPRFLIAKAALWN